MWGEIQLRTQVFRCCGEGNPINTCEQGDANSRLPGEAPAFCSVYKNKNKCKQQKSCRLCHTQTREGGAGKPFDGDFCESNRPSLPGCSPRARRLLCLPCHPNALPPCWPLCWGGFRGRQAMHPAMEVALLSQFLPRHEQMR